jgi:hypothetical protein
VQIDKVVGRTHEVDGYVYGKASANPLLDYMTYDIEFQDGCHEKYMANVIVENMYMQCDNDVNQCVCMEGIVNHNTDDCVVKQNDICIKHGSNKKVCHHKWGGTCVLHGLMVPLLGINLST